MAVRLRPQSSAWMAPHALAAQLTAQTGQIAGQGVAGLFGGIAQGVGAFTQARNRRQEMAINESRYKDALTRQDRSFQYGAAKDQASLLEDYMKGAEVEAALSAMSSPTGTPDPSKVANLRTAQSSMNALRAQLAQIGGVQPANVPPMPEAPAPLTPTAQMPGVQERLAKVEGFESLNDMELQTVVDGLTTEAEAIQADMDAILKVDKVKGAAANASKRSALNDVNLDLALASSVMRRRKAKAEAEQKKADLEAQATKEIKVHSEKQKIDAAADAAELPDLQADAELLGAPKGLKTKKGVEAGLARAKQDDAQAESRPFRERALKVREDSIALRERELEAKASGKKVGDNSDKWKMISSLQRDAEILARQYRGAEADAAIARAETLRKEIEKTIDAPEASAGGYPSWMPNDPETRARWDALPDVEKQKVIKAKGQ